jgi:hypothetical protein
MFFLIISSYYFGKEPLLSNMDIALKRDIVSDLL